jgi:hypothetical protein
MLSAIVRKFPRECMRLASKTKDERTREELNQSLEGD